MDLELELTEEFEGNEEKAADEIGEAGAEVRVFNAGKCDWSNTVAPRLRSDNVDGDWRKWVERSA